MSIPRQLARGLRSLFRRQRADDDISDELTDYLERAADSHVARGASLEAARRAAHLEVGNMTVAREQVRDYGWENAAEAVLLDVHYALRRLRTNPVFTLVSVATLALGIGATTAIFSVLNPILLQPLPYPGSGRLVSIADRTERGSPLPTTFGTFVELRARARSLESVAVADAWKPSLTGNGDPEQLDGLSVSANYFRTIGVRPAVGRDFVDSEDERDGPLVAVLSDALLQRRFGGDRSIVGRRILLDGNQYLVVGIMPAGFVDVVSPAARLWAPARGRTHAPFNSREWGHHYTIVGRLAPGVTLEATMRELTAIGRSPAGEFPRPKWADMSNGLSVASLQDVVAGSVRPALIAIAGAVLLLLAIAAVNVTNLLLARGAQRRNELAMRVALGAGRSRLLRQLLTESLVLALVGGVLGLVVAQVSLRWLLALSPAGLPRIEAIHLDGWTFAFALVVTALVGLAVGVAPALGASRAGVVDGLQQGSSRTVAGRSAARGTLVVAEVALAVVLLVGAGLLLRSVQHLFAVAPGFDPSRLLTMEVIEAGNAYHSDSARIRFFDAALDAVRHVPGVTSAAFTSQLPLSGDLDSYGYELQAFPAEKDGTAGSALRYAVSLGYVQTMRIPLVRGRYLDSTDLSTPMGPVLINESFARRAFGDRDPIGQRVRFGPEIGGTPNPGQQARGTVPQWHVVAGVVGDVRQQSLALDAPDAFYVLSNQWWWADNVQSLVVRTNGDAAALAPSIKRAIWSVDKNQPIMRVATMTDLIDRTASQQRFVMITLEAFALAALLLAAVGTYGVLAGRVAERTREIGVRAALGAAPGQILGMVVRQGLTLMLIGCIVGLAAAMAASRTLTTLLFGISRLDPTTYAAVVFLLGGVSLLACWAPAARASKVDPAITLRAE